MNYYWVEFQTGEKGTIIADKDLIEEITGKKIKSIDILPYPAVPVLYQHPDSEMPAFCLHGEKCKGRGSCPRSYACSE